MTDITTSDDLSTDLYKTALATVRPRIDALSDADLIAINVDITSAVKTVLGAMPRIRAVSVPPGVHVPDFNVAHFDDVELLARAAGWAHARFRGADQAAEPIEELARAMTATRERLVADYAAVSKRGVVDGHLLATLKGPVGFQNTADDVLAILAQLDAHEADVIAQSGIKPGELARIRQQTLHFVEALGRREQAANVSPEVVSTRARTFTLFARAYDDVRRHVTFIRWHEGDADEIAPSIYGGRQRGTTKKDAEPAAAPEAAAPVSTGSAAPATPAPAPASMRGGDPYTR